MMRRTYFIVLGLNYLMGFLVSLVFTFSYSGYASSLFFVKQVVSSVLCLIFITIPLESALINRLSQFDIGVSRTGLLWAACTIFTPYLYSGFISGEWGLSAGIIIGGSLVQLGVSILSANSVRKNLILTAAIYNFAGKLFDAIPISLVEYNVISDMGVGAIYFCSAFCVWGMVWMTSQPKISAPTENPSTSYRLASMLLEVVVISYLATLGADFKNILFFNSILMASLGILVVPNLLKIERYKGLIGWGLFSFLCVFIFNPSYALIIIRLYAFYCGYFARNLLLMVFIVIATFLIIKIHHTNFLVIASYFLYGLSTSLWAHSYNLMRTVK